jgi:hypothetical protein
MKTISKLEGAASVCLDRAKGSVSIGSSACFLGTERTENLRKKTSASKKLLFLLALAP